MATHRIPILGVGTKPDTSGNVFFEPYDVKATTDNWDRMVCIFNPTATKLTLHGGFTVPKNYVGSPKIVVVWTSTAAAAANVVWDFDYRAVGGNDTESLDDTIQESVTVTDAEPTAAHRRLEALMSLTAANLAVDDEVEFQLSRDQVDVADTSAAAAILFNALFEYSDA